MTAYKGVLNIYGFVYKIENMVNGKIYIGQTIDAKRREKEHFNHLRNNKHHNIHLQNAFNKYGEKSFKHTILNWVNDKEELDQLEIHFIQKYDCLNHEKGYNLKSGGSNGHHHPETCKKISEAKKELYKNPENNPQYGKTGASNSFYGKKHTIKTRRKISKAQKERLKNRENNPMYRKKFSIEHRRKISENSNHESWHGFKGATYSAKKSNPWRRVLVFYR